MKKTLILSIALLGAALHAQAATVISSNNADDSGGNSYYGFTCKLTDTFFTATGDPLGAEAVLNSLTIDARPSGSGTAFKVAVYQYTSDGAVGDFVALSENSVTWEASKSLTLTFGDTVTIETSQQYQYLFVSATTTVETLTDLTAEGATLLSNYRAVAVSESLKMRCYEPLPNGDGTYSNSNLASWQTGGYMPVVSFTVSALPVPEPATATLSLLALTGLCARRRRA